MEKKVIFLPFINGRDDTADGRQWRKEKERVFLAEPEISNLTKDIEQIRNPDPNADNDAAYYQALHKKKSARQEKWLNRLFTEASDLLKNKLDSLSDEERNSDDYVIVAAFPEFFWHDINDNDKHEEGDPLKNGRYIVGYHKPLYHNNMVNILSSDNNPFKKLTLDYPNLIIFGGTAMWKFINPSDHTDEKIYNTLFVFHSGKIASAWSKHFVSTIDGFYSDAPGIELVKNKIGALKKDYDFIPFVEFQGVKFTYDICLDFVKGENGKPLSTELCNKQKTDVNVLISAGMPILNKDLSKINSPVILRCDGSYHPYAEIALNGPYPPTNHKSISDGAKIGRMDIKIDI